MEYSLKQSPIVFKGAFSIFFTRPIAAACLAAVSVPLLLPLLPRLGKKRPGATIDSDEV